jgi:hypothetical protein
MKTTNKANSPMGNLMRILVLTLFLLSTSYAGLGWGSKHNLNTSNSTKNLDSSERSGFHFGNFQAKCGIGGDICGKTFPIGFLSLCQSDFTKKLTGLEVGREYTLTFYNMNIGFTAGGEIDNLEGWKMNIGGHISIVEEDTLTFTFTATASTTLIKITPKASGEMHFSMPLGFKVTCGEVSNVQCITLKTDDKGNYCTTAVPEGEANVTVIESTLPDGAMLTAGVNPNDFTVIAGQRNEAGTDGYTFPTPPALKGNIYGTVYEDVNEKGKKDGNEKGVPDINITIVDAEYNTFTVQTNSIGAYRQEGVAKGEATVTVDVDTLPQVSLLTEADPNPSQVDAVPGKDNDAGDDGYILITHD